METETASQKKWRLVREHQEAKACERALAAKKPRRQRRQNDRQNDPRPVWGSQDWAETYSDDLGESPDY